MLTIDRRASYRIITRAVTLDGKPLVALLATDADDCELCADADQLQARLAAHPDWIIVYNQHADARALVDGLTLPASQIYIEIRQDTKGVLGLHARRRSASGIDTLELIYQ
jgi:hypothetical protein